MDESISLFLTGSILHGEQRKSSELKAEVLLKIAQLIISRAIGKKAQRLLRMELMAFFSSRETCACEIPISPETSICVLPS